MQGRPLRALALLQHLVLQGFPSVGYRVHLYRRYSTDLASDETPVGGLIMTQLCLAGTHRRGVTVNGHGQVYEIRVVLSGE